MNFQLDLLENPFINSDISLTIFGKSESLSAGSAVQSKAMTHLKNENPFYRFGFGLDYQVIFIPRTFRKSFT
jgi:hypothetical protein